MTTAGKASIAGVTQGGNAHLVDLAVDSISLPRSNAFVPPAGSISLADGSNQTVYFGDSTGSAWISKSGTYGCLETYAPLSTSGDHLFQVYDATYAIITAVVSAGNRQGALATLAPPSALPTLTLGAAWQNTNSWDVTLVVMLAITANASLVISLGVGPTNAPSQQTLITGTTLTGLVPVTIKVPAGYYALLSDTGTGTISIVGQIEYAG